MSQPVVQPMALDDFFDWQELQDVRYELVGGVPVRMIAGATNGHDRIVVNLIAQLAAQLRGSAYRPFTADSSVETYPGQIRRPDTGVDCGPFRQNDYKASDPLFVAEVLSPSTRDFDTYDKLKEYRSIAGMAHILFVEPNAAEVVLWTRGGGAWQVARVTGLDAEVHLPAIDVTLRLADLYDGLTFPTGPRLAFGRLPDEPA